MYQLFNPKDRLILTVELLLASNPFLDFCVEWKAITLNICYSITKGKKNGPYILINYVNPWAIHETPAWKKQKQRGIISSMYESITQKQRNNMGLDHPWAPSRMRILHYEIDGWIRKYRDENLKKKIKLMKYPHDILHGKCIH